MTDPSELAHASCPTDLQQPKADSSEALLDNRVTEKPWTGETLWLVAAEWRGGHEGRLVKLENIYRDESAAKAKWDTLTEANHNAKYGRDPCFDCGFKRHPIRVFSARRPTKPT